MPSFQETNFLASALPSLCECLCPGVGVCRSAVLGVRGKSLFDVEKLPSSDAWSMAQHLGAAECRGVTDQEDGKISRWPQHPGGDFVLLPHAGVCLSNRDWLCAVFEHERFADHAHF